MQITHTAPTTGVQSECFAYNKDKHNCNALKELVCKKQKCPFYKHKDQFTTSPFTKQHNKKMQFK